MPLDPFFAERLRVHRRYLVGRALADAKRRLLSLWRRDAAAPPVPRGTRRDAPATAPATAPRSAPATAPRSAPATGPGAPPARHPATAPGAASPRAGAPAASRGVTARARHRRAALSWDRKELAEVGTPGPPLRTTEHVIPVPGHPDVRVRIYHPDASEDPPVCVAFFGGAFRIGGIDYPTTDAAHRRRAAASGVAIAAVDYALAPEHRYPTQVEQAYAALQWLVAHGAEAGVDSARLAVQGTSAGGCLAASLTLVNRDRAGHPIRLQILEVPVVDLTGAHIDLRPTWAMGVPALLVRRELRSVRRTYLGDASRAREPYASPLSAVSAMRGAGPSTMRGTGHQPSSEGTGHPSSSGGAGQQPPAVARSLPPAVILTAEYDPLRRQGAAYAAALRRCGVEASAVRYQGVIHDIPLFTAALPAARRWEADVVSALRTLHD